MSMSGCKPTTAGYSLCPVRYIRKLNSSDNR